MVPRQLAAATTLVLVAVIPASAEEAGRYRMSPVDGGFVRLDTETGAMSLCSGKDQAWSCQAMGDDQSDLRKRLAELEAENNALREENRRLEDVLGLGERKAEGDGTPAEPPGPNAFNLPSEEDIDKGFDYLERMLKKFRDRMKKLDDTEQPDGRTL